MSSVHQILPPTFWLFEPHMYRWEWYTVATKEGFCQLSHRQWDRCRPELRIQQTKWGWLSWLCSKFKDEVPMVPTLWSQQKKTIQKKKQRNWPYHSILNKHLWDPLFAMSLVFFGVRKSPHLRNLSHFDGLSLWSLRLQRSFACHHLCSASSHTFTTGQTSPLGVGIVYIAIKWDLKTR